MDKTLDDVFSELPARRLFLGGETGSIPPTYREVPIGDPAIRELPFVLMEIDPGEDGLPMAITWWPGGMVSDDMQRGPPMPVQMAFLELRMLMAINHLQRVLVTMSPGCEWNPTWQLPSAPN
jgi:hypothetical protein